MRCGGTWESRCELHGRRPALQAPPPPPPRQTPRRRPPPPPHPTPSSRPATPRAPPAPTARLARPSGPRARYLAVAGQWSEPGWLLWVLAAAVTCWVGGFDVLYALQDEAFDRAEGLHSAVVRFGQNRSLMLAKVLHGVTLLALVGFGLAARVWPPFYPGVVVGAVVIALEHRLSL